MRPDNFSEKPLAITELVMSLRALVLCIARFAIEQRGGLVDTNHSSFQLTCTKIPFSQQNACRQEVNELITSLQNAMVFYLENQLNRVDGIQSKLVAENLIVVPDLAHEDHIRVLPQGVPEDRGKTEADVIPDFVLVDDIDLILDRILDGDDVDRTLGVEHVDQGR